MRAAILLQPNESCEDAGWQETITTHSLSSTFGDAEMFNQASIRCHGCCNAATIEIVGINPLSWLLKR